WAVWQPSLPCRHRAAGPDCRAANLGFRRGRAVQLQSDWLGYHIRSAVRAFRASSAIRPERVEGYRTMVLQPMDLLVRGYRWPSDFDPHRRKRILASRLTCAA